MNDIAIKVENLSKKYTIGLAQQKHDTLRDFLVDAARGPFRKNGKERQEQSTLWALKDVSFEVKRGEVVGIIGRNGAGKSTLLKILSRITEPTSGRAIIKGRVGSLLEVGTGFHQELTGRENIYLNGAILGMRRREIERKFDDIVAFSEIEKFLDTPVKYYSSGMYVRLAFAVAAHMDPEILMVDEVLAVGDAEFQKKCLGKMGDVANEGRTVLFISHNMGAIKQLCNKGTVISKGCLMYSGDVQGAISFYTDSSTNTRFAKSFERSGSGKIRLDFVEIVDESRKPCDNILMGSNGWLELRGLSEKPLEKFALSVQINNYLGESIIYNYDQFRLFSTDKLGRFKFLVGLGEVFLLPGKYSVSVWLGRAGVEEFDYVKNASPFKVVQSEKIPVSDSLSQKYGYVFQNFHIKEL